MTRRLTKADEIRLLQNEIENVESFVASTAKKVSDLDAIRKTRRLTRKELEDMDNMIDYVHEKSIWLVNARRTVQKFFAPCAI